MKEQGKETKPKGITKNRARLVRGIVTVTMVLVVTVVALLFGAWEQQKNHIYKVYCVGDSITYGTGVVEHRDTESYPALLRTLLGERYEVYNYGVSGRTLLDNTAKPYRATGYLEELQTDEPDIIVILLGSNDSKPQNWQAAQYEAQYVSLVEELQNIESNPKLYIAIPPKAYPNEDGKTAYGIDDTVIGGEMQEIIQNVAVQTGTGLINLYEITENHPDYFTDGVHPNAAGNAVLAESVYESIKKIWIP